MNAPVGNRKADVAIIKKICQNGMSFNNLHLFQLVNINNAISARYILAHRARRIAFHSHWAGDYSTANKSA
jgi:hypothetical protein